MTNISVLPTINKATPNLREMTLEDIWKEAEKYGAVTVFGDVSRTMPKRYNCHIRFQCSEGALIKATSEYDLELHEALCQAVERAKDIASQFKGFGDER